MRLASCFGYAANQIRRDRPQHEELMHHVPGFSGKRNTSRSQNWPYIPPSPVLESLQREG